MILIGFGGDSQYKFMEDEAMSLRSFTSFFRLTRLPTMRRPRRAKWKKLPIGSQN